MKFSVAALFAALLISASSAQNVVSPTPGQTLSVSAGFNLTYDSERYFKESSRTISVVISPTADGSFPGGAPVVDLAPTSYSTRDSSAIYSVIMFPTFIYGASSTGNHTVYVIETYNAYGGLAAIEIIPIPVIFVP